LNKEENKNAPGSTTNKTSGRNSYRSLISPSSERAKNALADRLKRGIGASGNDDEDKEEEFEIKELTNEEYKDFLAQYDKCSKCVTPAPETS
jgi:translation initiation factor 2 beta subunit (eIF-2beta)/eIF-5